MHEVSLRALALVVVLSLAACGGGRSPTPAASAPLPPPPTATEQLAHDRAVAAECTNRGRKLVSDALAETSTAAQADLIERALASYRAAADAWVRVEGRAPKSDAAYWLADARVMVVRLARALHGIDPARGDVLGVDLTAALQAALVARDGPLAPDLVEPAAAMVVEVTAIALESGEAKRTTFEVDPRTGKPRSEPLSSSALAYVDARKVYLERIAADAVPIEEGGVPRSARLGYELAEQWFVHGHLAEARPFFEAIVRQGCPARAWRLRALDRLVEIASAEDRPADAVRWRALRSESARVCLDS